MLSLSETFTCNIYTFFNAEMASFEMPIQSKCKQYSPSEVDLEYISDLAFEVLGQRPFRWQLETTMAILTGNDVDLDVGTGCGKSLCFSQHSRRCVIVCEEL